MKAIYFLALIPGLFFLFSCSKPSETEWIIENESKHMLLEKENGMIEIIAPEGLTMWYNQALTGEYTISYRIFMVTEGHLFDRLSDMNCFWAANDPDYSDNFFARSKWRSGVFERYNSLNLFYVGYGGNDNTTTRFRRYYGEYYGQQEEKIKPLIQEYTDESHLLKPDKLYQVVIKVTDSLTSYSLNEETLFTYPIQKGEGDGYFGLRLLTNHIQLMDFNIEFKN